jgi:hypothetical protein
LNCKEKKIRRKNKELVRVDRSRTRTYVVVAKRESEKQTPVKEKTTLHRWTPDSARLLDAYLSVSYRSNVGGVLQCAE